MPYIIRQLCYGSRLQVRLIYLRCEDHFILVVDDSNLGFFEVLNFLNGGIYYGIVLLFVCGSLKLKESPFSFQPPCKGSQVAGSR